MVVIVVVVDENLLLPVLVQALSSKSNVSSEVPIGCFNYTYKASFAEIFFERFTI